MMNNTVSGVRIYVGNLPYSLRTDDLFKLFAQHGMVTDAVVMMETNQPNRSKGFGFVTMPNETEAERAVKVLNGKDILGRELVCNIAKPREPRFRF